MENYIAKLNEHVQKTKSSLRYEDCGCDGPDHIRTFSIRVVLNGKEYPEGVGSTKKEAKQKAAECAWKHMMRETSNFLTVENATPAPSTPAPSPITQPNFVSWLNEYGQKKHVDVEPVESTRMSPHGAVLCCRFAVGGKEYPEAVGSTRREAKEEAAKMVYTEVCGSEENGVKRSTPVNQDQGLSKLNVSEIIDMTGSLCVATADARKNYISLINDYCQKKGFSHSFVLDKKHGPPHAPQFYYKLLINGQEYSVGEGKTAKDAQQKAAQLAWSPLQSDASGDVPAEVSTPKSAIVCDMGSNPASVPIHYGVRFAGSLASLKDQSSEVKCKRRLAANFPNAHRNGKEEMMPNSDKISASEVTTSRFTSEFDSIVCLGSGGFGHVFKARNKLLNKDKAVKIVQHKEKAEREVKALSDLNHCNIVRYYSCWLEYSEYPYEVTSPQESPQKYLYIEMELCSSKNLRSWILRKNQNQSQERKEESLSIFRQIVSGVEYFHSKDLVHRDLKPENIMFSQTKEVKIGDFGLVTVGTSENRTEGRGTPSYMAPEQKDKKTYGRKVDIFPLGLIYFELIWKLSTEKRKEVWDDIRNQKTPAEFSLNYPFEDLMIKKMLSVNPEERPEAKAVQGELEKSKPCERITV